MAHRTDVDDTFPMKTLALVVVVGFVATGCCGSDGGSAKIVSASLDGWDETGFAVIGGFVSGSSTLTTTDSAGESKSNRVGFGGPIVGFVFDMHATGESTDLPDCGGGSLSIPDGGVTEDELFELYTGSGVSAGLVFGGTEHDLENGAGVKLDGGGISLGIGFFVGFEWFGLNRE